MSKQPDHPGKILRDEYLEPRGIAITEAARLMGVTRQALNNVVNGKSAISPDMAVRLGRLLGLQPETIQQWQKNYELNHTRLSRARRNRGRSDSYLIGSSDLVSWAETIDARYTLPQLIRMLVRASAGVSAVMDFSTGEDAQRSGWDGVAENSTRNAYVPLGSSGWELSTELNPQGKADEDYEKRKGDPRGLEPKATTFVAVSARKWAQKRQWLAEKRAEKFWMNVLAYDAVDLEQWLESCPEVGIWFTTRIGRRPRGVQSLESFWNEYRLSTSPPITPDLLLAGRNAEAEKLSQWLETGAGVFRIVADSVDEALAFAAAAFGTGEQSLKQEGLGQTIVVTDTEQARQLMSVEHQLTIGWKVDDPSMLGTLVDEGHRAILPLGRSSALNEHPDIELPRLGRAQFVAAVKDALWRNSLPITTSSGGDERRDQDRKWEEEANRRARKSGRSITVYRRLFASAGASQLPPWATIEEADELVPVVLAGSWSEENDADRLALAKLAGRDYGAVSRTVTLWKTQPDAPVRRIGDTWMLMAPLDAWSLMARYISDADRERYRQMVLEVLSEADPKLALAPNERWVAHFHGTQFRYSTVFREGLAESLILLAVVAEEAHQATLPMSDRLSYRLVTELLGNKSNPLRWSSLSGVLPALAEAAPDAFLMSLDDDLTSEHPDVTSLFERQEGPLGDGARHPHLLWALEILSWYPDYLPRAAVALAKLDEIAPEIKIVNRPSKSLSEIFCTWHRNTAASLDERLEAIDHLLQRQPKVGWELLLTLLPKLHDVSGNAAEPRWRAKPEVAPLTYGEIWQANDEVISRAIKLAGADRTRLSALISEIGAWSPEQRQNLLRQIETFSETCKDIDERTLFWHTVREFLARHRAFPEAAWSLPETDLVSLDNLLAKFEPNAPWERDVWLFDRELPEFTNAKALAESERDAAKKRAAVANEIYQHEGTDGLISFARRVKMPWLVGIAAAESITGSEIDAQILDRFLAHRDKPVGDCALAFVARRRELMGSQWSDQVLISSSFADWSSEKKAEFCLCMPAGSEAWWVVARLGSDVESKYWRRVHVSIIRCDNDESEMAIEKLIEFGHGLRALEQAGFQPEKLRVGTLVKVLEAAFSELVRTKDISEGTMLQYYLERIFEKLRAGDEVPDVLLGKLEWLYLPLFRFSANPITLHRFLQQDPEFFAAVVADAYKSEDGQDNETSDADTSDDRRRNRARMAWELLNSWHTPPGLDRNGNFDPDVLKDWVVKARARCLARRRSKSGDDRIGHLLAYVPQDADGAWPHAIVRNLIEEAESPTLEGGIHAGRFNSRGVYTKSPLEGGRGERELARQYRNWAKTASKRWPRTARLLNSLAEIYERFGRMEDVSAERLDLD